LCYNPAQNKVYCANLGGNSVTVYDGWTDTLLATLAIGESPKALSFSEVGDKVYCSDAAGDCVSAIDGVADSILVSIPVGDEPLDLVSTPVQGRTYVALYRAGSVAVIREGASIEEPGPGVPESERPASTFVHGAMNLTGSDGAALFDAAGRKVADLRPGPNELRQLAPGVYFVLGVRPAARSKIIICR
jgi:DNA-binding beta-propeller fold protein YncE